MALIDKINDGFIALTNLVKSNGLATINNEVLLPRKIGASQKWYQSGLRHGAEYPYPYTPSIATSLNGVQYFVPFTALEDANITALEIQCTTAQANATVSLGIYASDSNNDVANPLFTSSARDCSTTGAKNTPCNVRIVKGKVYWLSSMIIGTPSFQRNNTDSLFSIKGSTAANTASPFGYYTAGNTFMAESAPTNKIGLSANVPRVLFIVA